jgi:hypothetical protein
VISARLEPGGTVLLVAPVRGLVREAAEALSAIAEFAPTAIGVGASAEEVQGLFEFFVRSEGDPVVPLTPNETSEVRGLVRFGEATVPNPAVVETLRFAEGHALPVEGLDPSDETSASLFTEHIGYFELVRRTVAERRVARSPPAPSSADEFALAWERQVASGKGSQELALARDAHFAAGARRLAGRGGRVALLVDRERFDRVHALLAAPPSAA